MKNRYNRKFFDTNAAISESSAKAILRALFEVLSVDSMLDIGCGIGTWGKAGRALGLETYLGVDGDYVRRDQLMVDQAEFVARDVCEPLKLDQQFDLAISMEVGEHLPESSAMVLVDSLCAHAPVVLFSAAIPFQAGVDHVNEQWQSYWAGLFFQRGFRLYDCIRPQIWDRDDVAEYYKQNVLVYVDGTKSALIDRFDQNRLTHSPIVNLVHPTSYTIKADPRRWPLPAIVKHLPIILTRVMRNRVLARCVS